MSVYSVSRKSFISQRSALAKKQKDYNRIKLNNDLKDLLQNFINHKDSEMYEDLVCKIRDNGLEIQDGDLIKLLKEARGCVSLLDRDVHLFVKVLLVQRWSHRSKELAEEYHNFLLDLCTAHNYYTGFAIDQLVNMFKPFEELEWEDGNPTSSDKLAFSRIHSLLKTLIRVIPMASEILCRSVISNYPYINQSSHEHECYVYNLLEILNYQPSLRRDIFNLIITRLVSLDTNAPRREIEALEMAAEEIDLMSEEEKINWKCTQHPEFHTLDLCMDIMFKFLDSNTLDKNGVLIWDRTKSLFSDLNFVFENVILPTFSLQHVQYLMFKLVSLKPTLYNMFIKFLWNKVINPSVSPVIRQAAVCYIASLLSRANFIPLGVLKEVMSNIASWIHSYIASQDLEQAIPNMFIHGVFYNICQALFYVVAFRHRDLVESKQDLMFLQSLNLSKMVTCQLNPLRVCLPQIVNNFASVTRTYQLAYCYTIIEHNARNTIPVIYRDGSGVTITSDQAYLDAFFPFDPYLLNRSSKHIAPLYRVYNGVSADEKESSKRGKEDEDDFLMDTSATSLSHSFSYGSSPGFHI